MWPFIVLGELWFFLLLFLFVVVELAWVNYDRGFESLLTFLGFLGVLTLFSTWNPFVWAFHNVGHLAIGLGVYIVVGTLWSLFQWRRFARIRSDFFMTKLEEWKEAQGAQRDLEGGINDWLPADRTTFYDHLTTEWRSEFDDGIKYSNIRCAKDINPQVSKNKNRITVWMSMWPFDMFWTVVHDFMVEIWNWILMRLRKVYQGLSDNAFKNVYKAEGGSDDVDGA